MSSSIMLIKETSVSALTKALERYMPEVVGTLAKEYGFDEEAGLKMLGELRVQKEGKSHGVKAKRVVPKIIVPFCGVVQDDWCKAVRYNSGLFTQCTNACKKDSKFCTTCLKHVSTDGIPQYGLIEERGNEGWTGPNGKVPVNYGNIMSKIGVTKEQAIAEAERLGWTITEEQFEVVKTRKGRPAKKAKETTDEKPKKRGRPKKSKPVVEGGGVGDDLIAKLVEKAKLQNEVVAAEETEDEEAETPTTLVDFGSSSEEEEEEAAPEVEPTQSPAEHTEEVVAAQEIEDEESPAEHTEEEESTEDEAVEKKPKKVTRKKKTAEEKQAEKLAKAEAKAKLAADKKAAKEAEKEAEKLAKAEAKAKLAADKKAAKEAEKKATKLAKKLAKAEAEKLAKAEAEKLAKAEAEKLKPEEEEEVAEALGELTIEETVEEEEEEDAVEVIKFTHEGVEYLRDADGTIYDVNSQEEIGEWDDESKTLSLI